MPIAPTSAVFGMLTASDTRPAALRLGSRYLPNASAIARPNFSADSGPSAV